MFAVNITLLTIIFVYLNISNANCGIGELSNFSTFLTELRRSRFQLARLDGVPDSVVNHDRQNVEASCRRSNPFIPASQ